jgi:Coenzyme PQQ synthesis protein D (PqqD)
METETAEPLPDRVEAIPFDGHLVLIRGEREIIVLNEAARLIWQAMAEGAAAADVARDIAEGFGVSLARARADVATALADWRARGLIGAGSSAQRSAPKQSGASRPPLTDVAVKCTYALCGHPVRFRFQDPDVEGLVRPLLSPSEVGGAAAGEVLDLYRDGAEHVIAANGAEIGRSRLAEEVLGLAIGRVLEVSYPDARWLAVFHAGAVANRHHAIVMPGGSGSGKSTLTAALVHAGHRYLSDDIVPLDGRTGRVLPVPLASSLKRGSWPVLAARFSDLEGLPTYRDGGRERRYLDLSTGARAPAEGGVPVQAMVFPQYQPVGPTQLEALRLGQALEWILQARCWISLDRDDVGDTLQGLRDTPPPMRSVIAR